MLKGAVVGTQIDAQATNQLGLTWAYGTHETYLSPDAAQLNCEWVQLCYEEVFDAATIQRIMALPNYHGAWLLQNEPDLNWGKGVLPQAAASTILQKQIAAITAYDPNAKLIVGMGSMYHLPHNRFGNPPYFPQEWDLLPVATQQRVDGFHIHIYPGIDTNDLDLMFDPPRTTEAIRGGYRWMKNHGQRDKELWVSEFGFDDDTDEGALLLHLPLVYNAIAALPFMTRLAWFATSWFRYVHLTDTGKLTCAGKLYSRL